MNSFHYVRIVATTSLPSPLAVTMREYKVLGTLPLLNFLIGHQENLRNSCEVCLIRDVHVQYKKSLNHDTRGSFSFSSTTCVPGLKRPTTNAFLFSVLKYLLKEVMLPVCGASGASSSAF